MKCNKCGQPVQIDNRFCAICGSKQEHSPPSEPLLLKQNPPPTKLSQNLVQVTDFDPEISRSQGEGRR